MFIEVNKRVSVDDLLKGMIIQSGNDASVALAEHVAGSEEAFANLMNDHARRLGMLDTHFVNATGLPDPEHYTTPRDIAMVTEATIREFPELYKLYAVKEFTYNDIRQHNRNNLLWRDETVDGVKTGHTEAAGLLSGGLRQARRHAPDLGGHGDREREGAPQREPVTAQLRVPLLRDAPAVWRRRPPDAHPRVDGRAGRAHAGARERTSMSPSRAASMTS